MSFHLLKMDNTLKYRLILPLLSVGLKLMIVWLRERVKDVRDWFRQFQIRLKKLRKKLWVNSKNMIKKMCKLKMQL